MAGNTLSDRWSTVSESRDDPWLGHCSWSPTANRAIQIYFNHPQRVKKLLLTARKVRRELNLLLGLAFVVYLITEFWLRRLPPFMGWADAHRVADLTSNLCLAYVGSWIFFFVADHFDKVEGAETMSTYIEGHLYTILEGYFTLSFRMSKFQIRDNSEARNLFRSQAFHAALFQPLDAGGPFKDEFRGLLADIHAEFERSIEAVEALLTFKEYLNSGTVRLLLEIKARMRYPMSHIESLGDSDLILKRGVMGYATLHHFPTKLGLLTDWERYSGAIEDLFKQVKGSKARGQNDHMSVLLGRMSDFSGWCGQMKSRDPGHSSDPVSE